MSYRSRDGIYRRPARRRSTGPRPDRVAAWAVALGVLTILLASATSRADVTGGTGVPPASQPAGQSAGGGAGAQAPDPQLLAKVASMPAERATWYGPGFFGSRTACGTVLRHSTIGVAHRHLPCGTPVTFYYQGRILTVPVIDRGPYARHVTWDLTRAAARQLGIVRTSTVRALH